MRTSDIIAAVGLLGFVALMAFVVIPNENTGGIWYGLSPYFYPMIMLAGVAISCVGLLVQAITRPSLYTDQPNPIGLSQLGFFLLSIAIVLGGVFIIDRFGFWLGGPLLIAAMMIFMGERNPIRIVPVSVLTVAAAWALVTWGLKTPLP
ncbi:MAG: tripartite tricarboxylate transporter TctB family protein [Hyphomicrobiaceae bacterium]